MILKGLVVADHLSEELIEKVGRLSQEKIIPTLGIIRVGTGEDDLAYERNIVRKFEKLRIKAEIHSFTEQITTEDVQKKTEELNHARHIHGILLFRPLPGHLDEDRIRNSICPEKDVDCASDPALSSIFLGKSTRLPCTAGAVVEMLRYYKIPIEGKKITVVGRSMVVGKPLGISLLHQNATVTMAHSKTSNLAEVCRGADIIVVAAGHPNTLTEDMVRENAIVIDVGINVLDGKLVGDADFESISKKASISPVPGGVGSITTSVLAKHVVEGALRQRSRDGLSE